MILLIRPDSQPVMMVAIMSDIKVSLTGLARKIDRIEKGLFNKRVSTRMAKLARSIVYKRTKAGKGVSGNSNPRLKKLSDSYKLQRSGKIKFRTINGRVVAFPGQDDRPRTIGKFFKPAKSNLTYTGQMLESMIIKAGRFTFGVNIPNTKRQRQKGQGNQKQLTNADVAGYVEANGREFFALSKGEVRIILFEYEKILRQLIRKEGL